MSLAVSSRRVVSEASSSPFMLPRKVNREPSSETGEIFHYPGKKRPPVHDYARRCKLLIQETFPERSQHQTCVRAAQMTGEPISTFYRIMAGETKSPDARVMLLVMAIRAARDPRPFSLGNGFAVRIFMESQDE